MATRAQLVEELLGFPAHERVEAVRALLDSLESRTDPAEVEAAWRTEIAQRLREIDDGTVALIDGATAMSDLRARARARVERRSP